MPPTLVRPQTFTVGRRALGEETSPSSDLLQQPDSASPAVRSIPKRKYLFNLRLLGMCESIALQAYLSLPTFLRRRELYTSFDVRLSVPVV